MKSVINDMSIPELETALPSLISKLKEMQLSLSPEEQKVYGEIIKSASLHTNQAQSSEDLRPGILLFAKPKSAYATRSMKNQFKDLPKQLGID